MLVRDVRRLALFVGPFIVILYLGWACFHSTIISSRVSDWWKHAPLPSSTPGLGQIPNSLPDPIPGSDRSAAESHHEVFSTSTPDRKYFRIILGDERAMNPNIIPHPAQDDTWVVVAQRHDTVEMKHFELVCYAAFDDTDAGGALRCSDPPTLLPVQPTTGISCDGELAVLALNVGPHDARVFHGPRAPLIVYGSNSRFTCFGQWVQDFAALMEWGAVVGAGVPDGDDDAAKAHPSFPVGTEMQRPGPYGRLEKNWFLFWDDKEETYVHYDVAPKRAFAKLEADGSVGEDLAPLAAAAGDDACIARYMPVLATESESIHQATNSLSITLCRRSDPGCLPDASNTFLFTVFQHKSYHDWHSVYEPYVMLFAQRAPFEVHAISRKPIWIHGRSVTDKGQDEMFYVVSMSWKMRAQKYHGYLDDVLFVAFGIEDKDTAGIDVVAGDLLAGLSLCSDP